MHGGGIDQPLVAIRHAYSDSPPGARSIFPQTNARGQYDHGVGSVCTIVTDPGEQLLPPHDPYDFPGDDGEPDEGTGPTEEAHCIHVDWPGKSLWPTTERQSRWHAPDHWSGSLLMHSRDPSGQYYRRNRFYDAGSGRFTQEDPIGIAGGLNVYGYANGDPISYSDPYGLAAEGDCKKPVGDSEKIMCRTAEKLAPVAPALNVAGAMAVGSLGLGIGAIGAAEMGGVSMLGLSVTLTRVAPGAPMFAMAGGAASKLNTLSSQTGLAPSQIVSAGINSAKWIDHANRGNIQGFISHPQNADLMVRVSFNPDFTRVISAGVVRVTQFNNWVSNGRLTGYLLPKQ